MTASRRGRRLAFTVLALVAGLLVVGLGAGLALHELDERNRPEKAKRLAEALGIGPGDAVAEIGAGGGQMALLMAGIVGPKGRVFATEMGDGQLARIRRAAERGGLANVTVLRAGERDSNLPAGCCDAVYAQRVYHHLADPEPVVASIGRALKPEGRLAILEFEPGWLLSFTTPRGVPDRGGHGVPKPMLLQEMRGYGFQPLGEVETFDSELYLAVFRR